MSAAPTPNPAVARRLRAATDIATRLGVGAVLLCEPPSVRWAGVRRPKGVRVLICAGEAVVVEPQAEPGPRERDAIGEQIRYGSRRSEAEALRMALAHVGLGSDDALAIDTPQPPASIALALADLRCIDAAGALAAARLRKEPDELEAIEGAAQLAAAGHAAARGATAAGVSELELWAAAREAIEQVAGGPVEAVVDLMVGEDTTEVGRAPGELVAQDGDPVLFDLAPCLDGYWADSCATWSCGKATRSLIRRHEAVRDALTRGLEAARPGVRACQVDAEVRSALDRAGLDCPHHTGHGVGTAPQEAPWLVPDDPTVLEEGMVLALEPGVYSGGVGVRLEHLALVEAAGARPLTTHSLELT